MAAGICAVVVRGMDARGAVAVAEVRVGFFQGLVFVVIKIAAEPRFDGCDISRCWDWVSFVRESLDAHEAVNSQESLCLSFI